MENWGEVKGTSNLPPNAQQSGGEAEMSVNTKQTGSQSLDITTLIPWYGYFAMPMRVWLW